jgi:rod shape-determining protein MreC
MQSFQRFDRTTSLTLLLLVIAFLLATFDVRSAGGGVGTTMREGAQTLFSPLQEAASAVTRPVVGFIDALSEIASLREENEELRLENEQLSAQIQQYAALEAELAHLMEINDLDIPGELPTVTARIESPGSSSFDKVLFINKGAGDGITAGDAVVDEQGLVGRVDLVFDNSARVKLIIDPNVTVNVRDDLTNQTGLLTGDNERLILRIFGAKDPVLENSVVVTSGSRFPPGIVVGTVTETANDEAGFDLVTYVEPAVNFTTLDFVKVIVGYSPLDAEPAVEEEPATEQPAVGGEETTTTSTTEAGG